jgi:hypothetical protein
MCDTAFPVSTTLENQGQKDAGSFTIWTFLTTARDIGRAKDLLHVSNITFRRIYL